MLLLHPREVRFLSTLWRSVTSIVIDRAATRVVAEVGDGGPHVVFADCPQQRVTVRVVMDITEDTLASPALGEQGALSFVTAPTGVNGARSRIALQGVVASVTHELSLRRGAVRTVELVAISSDGSADPVTITDIAGDLTPAGGGA